MLIGFEYENSPILYRIVSKFKSIINKSGLISDDYLYKKYFTKVIGPKLHQMHLNEFLICCTFCSSLKKSNCHNNCFKCAKNTYEECSSLLPGTFSFMDSHFDTNGNEFTPWIFKTPCTKFERIDSQVYFKNFNSSVSSITVANYESLEGIFMGIYRNKRPCHICASVNLDIYNNCSVNEGVSENKPCYKIIGEITSKYNAILGMIKYP